MSKYQELNKMLIADMPIPYWEDEQQFLAQDLVQTFGDADWVELSEDWRGKSPSWQQRLCQTLSEAVSSDIPVGIVIELTADESYDVSLAAVDALRTMDVSNLKGNSELIDRVSELSKGGKIAQAVCNDLLKKLNR